MQELADVQARLAEAQVGDDCNRSLRSVASHADSVTPCQANYQAVREAYQTLQELRETGPESTLREVQEQIVGRLEGKC